MSDVLDHQQENRGEPAGADDVERMLTELRRDRDAAILERDTERNQRLSLQDRLRTESEARSTAEQQRDDKEVSLVNAAEQRFNAEKNAASSGLTAQKSALVAAKDAYARHAEAGEWKEAADAQERIADATARVHSHEQKLEWLDSNKEKLVPKASPQEARQPPARQAPPPPPPATGRYGHLVNGGLVGGEEAWLDKRPRFTTDENYRTDVFNASVIASRKFPRGSADNLAEIERILGESQEPARRDPQERDPPPARQHQDRAPSADLPASRRAGPGHEPAGSARAVRLTENEVEVADGMYGQPNSDNYIADPGERYKHYWENKQKLIASGRLTG
jgi:hypothetical protein